MYIAANLLLMGAFLCALFTAGGLAVRSVIKVPVFFPGLHSSGAAHKKDPLFFAGIAQWLALALMTAACAFLLYAFLTHDFRFEYVVRYSDRSLPVFYLVTALWAGQSGSLLFWAWTVSLSGAIFSLTPAYRSLSEETRIWFWAFFLTIIAFFLLVLIGWSNPFDLWRNKAGVIPPPPADGFGLNPMLQNPGMIFHPPLLFLGYGGFVIPGCLALAQASGAGFADKRIEPSWGQASRPFILVAWLLLTSGIILGAWWAYMELGWGGYWAWDPVENASLIPWLAASAYLHTAIIERTSGKLRRVNVLLMALTTISAFFATYLVRSGVIESLHAFGEGTVGPPLLTFILIFTGLTVFIALALPKGKAEPLGAPQSREGLLSLVAWVFLALSCIILTATLWPLIMKWLQGLTDYLPIAWAIRIADAPTGLDANFYNRTCLPLFAALSILLLICPFRTWRGASGSAPVRLVITFCLIGLSLLAPMAADRFSGGGALRHILLAAQEYAPLLFMAGLIALTIPLKNTSNVRHPRLFQGILILAGFLAVFLFRIGVREPAALVAASCSFAAITGILGLFALNPGMFRARNTLAACGVHLGLLMLTVGVAFSGPYQAEYTMVLSKGETVVRGEYSFTLSNLQENVSKTGKSGLVHFRYLQADIIVSKNGLGIGILQPQQRLYTKFGKQSFAEVSTLFSMGNEVYATLHNTDEQNRPVITIHINPLVNWLWVGGALMCLFPLVALMKRGKKREDEACLPDNA